MKGRTTSDIDRVLWEPAVDSDSNLKTQTILHARARVSIAVSVGTIGFCAMQAQHIIQPQQLRLGSCEGELDI